MSRSIESKFKTRYDWFVHTIEIVNSKTYTTTTLTTRLRRLQDFYSKLTEAYEGILTSITDVEILEGYDSKYRQATEIYDQLEAVSAAYPSLDGTHIPTQSAPAARLPTINLTTFNGDIYSWSSFISLFTSLVLCRRDISKTEKFHYLFSNLVDEPRSLIKHLPMIDESLDCALDILRSRYDNKRLLADAHIGRILNIPRVTEIGDLRTKILNPMLECTRALGNMGITTDTYIIVHIILSRLPREIRNRFEQNFSGGKIFELPTCEQLIEFLQGECRFIDAASTAEGVDSDRREVIPRKLRTVHTEIVRHKNKCCDHCGLENHTLVNCFKFKALSVRDRKYFIAKNNLCYKCFGKHAAHSCSRSVPCGGCSRTGHHGLICLANDERRESPSRNERPAVMTSSRNVGRSGQWRVQLAPRERSQVRCRSPPRRSNERESDERSPRYGRRAYRGKQGDHGSDNARKHYNSE